MGCVSSGNVTSEFLWGILVQALTIAVGVAFGILLAGCIAVGTWWLVKRGHVPTVAAKASARYLAIRRSWQSIVFGSISVVALAFVGSPPVIHPAPRMNENFIAVLPDPTFSRSLQSSFESSLIGSTLLRITDGWEASKNQAAVTDAEIEDRITREALDDHIGEFIDVTTRGELDAKVARIQRQEFNTRVGEVGGWQGVVTDLISGAACFAVLLMVWQSVMGRSGSTTRSTPPSS